MNLTCRPATDADLAQLAAMNQRLIRDEGHRNPMSLEELEKRMAGWLAGEYEAAVFEMSGAKAGYALYKQEPDWIYVRQFFISPEFRRKGIGRLAMQWLIANPWREARRIRLDVLVGNVAAAAFWRSMGFQEYCVSMELEFGEPYK